MNSRSAEAIDNLLMLHQEALYAMQDSLRQLEGHLKNIQARTFEMTEEISYLITDNMRLLSNINDQASACSVDDE
jgi:hypothetical protein